MANPAVTSEKLTKAPDKLVKVLIPYVLSKDLIKGLGLLGKRYSPEVLLLVKNEAIRRCKPATQAFDTKGMAKFALKRIQTAAGTATTDFLGEQIYQRALKEFAGQYTQGVFEAVSDPKLYELEYKDYLANKVLAAFEMPWIPAEEESKPIPLMVNIKVLIEEISTEQEVPVYALSESELHLRLNKKPTFSLGQEVVVDFEPLPHSESRQEALYKVSTLSLLRSDTGSFWQVVLKLVGGFNSPWYQKLSPFLFSIRDTTPAIPAIEQQRVKHDLYRDLAALNSPWVSVFSEEVDGNLEPSFVVCTPANADTLSSITGSDGVSINKRIWSVSLEEAKTTPSYVIRVTLTDKNGKTKDYSTTLRIARHFGFATTLIARGLKAGTLKIMKVVCQQLSEARSTQFKSTYGVNSTHGRQLQRVSHLVSILDITNAAVGKRVEYEDNGIAVPPLFLRDGDSFEPIQLRQNDVERRREPRFQINGTCEVAVSLFNRIPSKVIDISARGIRLKLSVPPEMLKKPRVRLLFKPMGLFFKAYDVVSYNRENGLLQLKVPEMSETNIRNRFEQFRQKQGLLFSGNNVHESQQYLFDILVRVGGIHAPSSHIMLGPRSLSYDKRLVMLIRGQSTDLASPLKQERGSKISVGKLLADTMHGKPNSKLLASMTNTSQAQATVGLVTLRGGREVIVPATIDGERETYSLASSKQRKSIVDSHQITMFAGQCETLSQYHVDLRMALLLDVDVPKVRSIEKHIASITHMLTLVDTSRFLKLVLDDPKSNTSTSTGKKRKAP